MPNTMIRLSQAELDRIARRAKDARAQMLAAGVRRFAAAVRRLAAGVSQPAAAPRRARCA